MRSLGHGVRESMRLADSVRDLEPARAAEVRDRPLRFEQRGAMFVLVSAGRDVLTDRGREQGCAR